MASASKWASAFRRWSQKNMESFLLLGNKFNIVSYPAGLTGDRHLLWTGHQLITSLSPVVHAILHSKKLVITGSKVTSLSPVCHQLCQLGRWDQYGLNMLGHIYLLGQVMPTNSLTGRCTFTDFAVQKQPRCAEKLLWHMLSTFPLQMHILIDYN